MENAPTRLTHARRGTGNTILVDYKKPCDGCHGRYADALAERSWSGGRSCLAVLKSGARRASSGANAPDRHGADGKTQSLLNTCSPGIA